jgi:hypothetical protein
MKPFKYFFIFNIFFLITVLLNISPSYPEFSASLGGDGVVTLSGSKSFDCVPSGFDFGSMAIVTLYMTPGVPAE